MSADKKTTPQHQSNASKFLNGGLAGMAATCVVQPIDLIKTRMQLAAQGTVKKNSFQVTAEVMKSEGFFGMYNGYVNPSAPSRLLTSSLSAGLLRQATYTTTRLGVYQVGPTA